MQNVEIEFTNMSDRDCDFVMFVWVQRKKNKNDVSPSRCIIESRPYLLHNKMYTLHGKLATHNNL